jgi:hypothetical protein
MSYYRANVTIPTRKVGLAELIFVRKNYAKYEGTKQ